MFEYRSSPGWRRVSGLRSGTASHTIEVRGRNRKGYHIDGCIHRLVGTKDGTPMNDLWKSVGALDGVEIHHPETFLTFEHESGTVPIYRDLDRLRVRTRLCSAGLHGDDRCAQGSAETRCRYQTSYIGTKRSPRRRPQGRHSTEG